MGLPYLCPSMGLVFVLLSPYASWSPDNVITCWCEKSGTPWKMIKKPGISGNPLF